MPEKHHKTKRPLPKRLYILTLPYIQAALALKDDWKAYKYIHTDFFRTSKSQISNHHLRSYHCHHHCLLSGPLVVRLNRPGRYLLPVWEDQINLVIILLRLGLTWDWSQETLKSQTKTTTELSFVRQNTESRSSVGIKATKDITSFQKGSNVRLFTFLAHLIVYVSFIIA